MPLFVSPASAKSSAAVSLHNTMGRPVQFRVILSKCNGHVTYASAPMTLANNSTWTVPAGGRGDPHARVVTFSVSQPGGTVAAQASIVSSQGCSHAQAAHAATGAAAAAPQGHALTVTTPKASSPLDSILIGLLVLMVGVAAIVLRRVRRARIKRQAAHYTRTVRLTRRRATG